MAQPGGGLTVGVLGPLEVAVGGQPLALRTGRLRTLLAVLAMSAGRAVTVERLAVALWGEQPPDNARRTVQTYLTRLRGALGPDAIGTRSHGYLLDVTPDQVDAFRFERLLGAAAAQPDPAAERARLVEALALWRGTPFAGVQSPWLEHTEAPRLTERYLAAVERRVDLDLAQGRLAAVPAELRELIGRHPLRESLWVRLLVALDRGGRPAEALEQYERIRVRLADELGTDPGPELRQIHADLLAGTPAAVPAAPPTPAPAPAASTPAGAGAGAGAGTGRPVPRQLPADIDGFTGRDAALKALDDLVSEPAGRTANAVVISAIAGTAGVGKTALALHWAHRVAERFPDGQLYVNLRGFSGARVAGDGEPDQDHPHRSVRPMAPDEAVRGFLDALDVPPQRVPSGLDAQAALYRSLVADRRMLVLLDNARDAGQVRPLLPGAPTCLVVVTSRNQLTGLAAAEAARPLVLDLLPLDEARTMLARRLGADRVAAEPAAAAEIITRCARLPLALAIAAARAAVRPGFRLATLAAELRDARPSSLTALDAGDPSTDVRTVFSWSYRSLRPAAARLFRLLGLPPGPDLTGPAAASLAGSPAPELRSPLAELVGAHLVAEPAPGRYALHDLLRDYAAELAQTGDTAADRDAARHRLLDHYLHTGHAAARLLNPHREPIQLPPRRPGATQEELADHGQAMGWLRAEQAVLLAAVGQAATTGFDRHAWQLAWTVSEFLYRQGYWQDLTGSQLTALVAARRIGDRSGQALAHRTLGYAYAHLDTYAEARTQLGHALDLYRQVDDQVGQAHAHHGLSLVYEWQGRQADSLSHAEQALQLYRRGGDRVGQARALNAVGWDHAQLGNYEPALRYCRQALRLHQELGNRAGEAVTWDSLGYAHHQLGQHGAAAGCYQTAVDLFHDLDDRYSEADTLVRLGDTHAASAAGDPDAAGRAWRRALTLLDPAGQPAAQVRDKLDRLA